MADLSSLTADQLSETVSGVEAMHGEWSRERLTALADLVRRLKTAEDALARLPGPLRNGNMAVVSDSVLAQCRTALAAIRPNPEQPKPERCEDAVTPNSPFGI